MSVNNHKIRMTNTEEALTVAMIKLLESHNLENILVRDICEEAQITRAAFYAHFDNKYDLINYIANRRDFKPNN